VEAPIFLNLCRIFTGDWHIASCLNEALAEKFPGLVANVAGVQAAATPFRTVRKNALAAGARPLETTARNEHRTTHRASEVEGTGGFAVVAGSI
jgi:hypothetical protein